MFILPSMLPERPAVTFFLPFLGSLICVRALLPKIKRKNPNIKTKATPNKEFVKSNESNGAEGQSYPTEVIKSIVCVALRIFVR